MTRVFAMLAAVAMVSASAVLGADDDVKQRISEQLQAISPDLEPEAIEPSPLPGIYQIMVQGQVVFISEDGRYLIQGDIMDLETRQSVGDSMENDRRRQQIEQHGEENMIVYTPEGETRHTVTVFTDIDCPYCRQMHQQLDQYLERGIAVRYIQMPRAGVDSDSYHKAVSVWCADDRHAAMDEAKDGVTLKQGECDNPVSEQLDLARSLGVNATPTFVGEDGSVYRGLVPPDDLLAQLEAE